MVVLTSILYEKTTKKDVSCKDFKAYFTKYLIKNHELTRFIAQKVADYYL